MFAKLAFLFIVVPLIEIALLVELGKVIDVWATLGIVLATGFIGAWLARLQGRRALAAIKLSLGRGEIPGDALLDGLLVLIAGIVLITPGILTDLTGIALLIPPIRAVVRRRLQARFKARMAEDGGWGVNHQAYVVNPGSSWSTYDNGEVIDVAPDGSETTTRSDLVNKP